MVSVAFFAVVFCLQEVYGIKMFVEMDKSIRFVDTVKRTNEVLVQETQSIRSWDYHHDKGYLYYVERRSDPSDILGLVGDLKRLNIKDKTIKSLPFSSDNTGELEVAVDYVRDELYVVTGKDTVVRSDLDGQNRVDIMTLSEANNTLSRNWGDFPPYTIMLNIDPYERLMFVTYNCTNESYRPNKHTGTIVLRADLNGKEIQLDRGYTYFKTHVTAIDVSVPWLYLIHDTVRYFPYSSPVDLGPFPLHKWAPRLNDAFNRMLYVPFHNGYNGIEVFEYSNYAGESANKTSVAFLRSKYKKEDICKFQDFKYGCIGLGVKVYDLRRQRKMLNDKFQCKMEKFDTCSHGCEAFEDSGDTCTCPEFHSLKEDEKTCVAESCKIPDPTGHRVFSRYPCRGSGCRLEPGAPVAHQGFVQVTCEPGFFTVTGIDSFSSDSSLSTCNSEAWFPPFPRCVKLCPPLTSLTVKFSCYQGPRLVSCDKPMLPGTVVEFRCKEYHESGSSNQANGLTCTSSGEWSRTIPSCTPSCGRSNLHDFSIDTAIVGDTFSELGNFPWHAGLYHKRNGTWEAVCGGTLISPKAILTAAHCVTNPCDGCKATEMQPEEVMVALGKKYRLWGTTERSQVKKRIKEIRVHIDYIGSTVNYGQDIAVLVMESPVEVTNNVMPACMDFTRKHVKQFQEDKTLLGYVAGWGNTEECSSFGNACGSVSDTLKYAKTTIISYIDCFQLSQSLTDKRLKSSSRLTSDKFCSGNGSESVVQKGDSGGGMTFVFDGLHHVVGVVSLKLQLEVGEKKFFSFGAFTNVYNYLEWVKLQLYDISF